MRGAGRAPARWRRQRPRATTTEPHGRRRPRLLHRTAADAEPPAPGIEANPGLVLAEAESRVGDGGVTFLARQPGGRNEADRAEPEHAEQRRAPLDALSRRLTTEPEELALLVGAAPGPHAVGGGARKSRLVMPLAVEHDLRARRRPLAQPAHELGMAREIPFAMPVGDHQEGGNDAALGAEGPQPLGRRRERRGHVVNRDQQAHRRRTRRYTSKSRSKTPSQPWCAAAYARPRPPSAARSPWSMATAVSARLARSPAAK